MFTFYIIHQDVCIKAISCSRQGKGPRAVFKHDVKHSASNPINCGKIPVKRSGVDLHQELLRSFPALHQISAEFQTLSGVYGLFLIDESFQTVSGVCVWVDSAENLWGLTNEASSSSSLDHTQLIDMDYNWDYLFIWFWQTFSWFMSWQQYFPSSPVAGWE